MIAALFVETGGVYYGLPNVKPYCKYRDARTYNGAFPIVGHPPCQRWSILAHSVQARYKIRIKEDDGLFAFTLETVERVGGVIEHPALSMAWKAFSIDSPIHGMWYPTRKGWTCSVAQSAYGHKARKMTWLYYVGKKPFSLNWEIPPATHQISRDAAWSKKLAICSKNDANGTPIPFRDLLIELAEFSQ